MSEVKMTPAEVLSAVDLRFKTANGVPVERAAIRADEWAAIRGLLLAKDAAAVAALVAERDEYKREAAAQLQEMEDMHTLIMRQGDLLTCVVNAIRGEPSEDCRHSHHDAAELAAKVVAERDALRSALDDLMSWFPEKPSPPEWRIVAGQHGADEAVKAARAALAGAGHD